MPNMRGKSPGRCTFRLPFGLERYRGPASWPENPRLCCVAERRLAFRGRAVDFPPVTPIEIAGLAAVAALAGAMNAVAGGGTLLTFPALIFFGTRPEAANATSTLALLLGTLGSMFGYREHAPRHPRLAGPLFRS